MEINIALLAIIVFQQVYFNSVIQKMLNKLMSRDFVEYKQAEGFKPVQPRTEIKLTDPSMNEDMGVMNGF